MSIFYNTIEDFIKIKDKCIFCHKPLKPILTNLLGNFSQMADIYAPLQNHQFKFRLKYDGDRLNFDVNAIINTEDNKFNFFLYGPSAVTYSDVISVFMMMKPCIELICDNKDCGTGYYIQSNYLVVGPLEYIRPLMIWIEAFNMDKLVIHNFYGHKDADFTRIFSKANPSIAPIIISKMNFESWAKEKLFNRIKTIVNFG